MTYLHATNTFKFDSVSPFLSQGNLSLLACEWDLLILILCPQPLF